MISGDAPWQPMEEHADKKCILFVHLLSGKKQQKQVHRVSFHDPVRLISQSHPLSVWTDPFELSFACNLRQKRVFLFFKRHLAFCLSSVWYELIVNNREITHPNGFFLFHASTLARWWPETNLPLFPPLTLQHRSCQHAWFSLNLAMRASGASLISRTSVEARGAATRKTEI